MSTKTSFESLEARIAELEARLTAVETKGHKIVTSREMTDDDARRILTGDLANVKHKDAADTLGLSYGQVYSCRLEFTFKAVHKAMREAGQVNPWKK